ncbi:MAG: DUF4910 domain-containing protein [Trueperaceae bacterium]|nr:DUF4910 domain-containing protein [Trueperaceae bacterium]
MGRAFRGTYPDAGADMTTATVGATMMRRIVDLYPILRSITGPGLRATLRQLQSELPGMVIHEAPSGTQVFDWTVPPEWSVREAHVTAPDGRRIADVAWHNLMLANYSTPFRGELTLAELRPHLHSLPDAPDAIPYVTHYYDQDWGFCLPHFELERLPDGVYSVVVDSDLNPSGSLSYGELVLPGETQDEVLLSAHVCHPSLANDNLSAVSVLTELASRLQTRQRRYTYRVLFAPGTIGALVFLARTPEARPRTKHGLVLAGLGDSGPLHYKRTRDGATVDRVVEHVIARREGSVILDFDPFGYDERQYGSPGVRMPVGRLGRAPHGTYPEYHTSKDDLSFVKATALNEALEVLEDVVQVIENDARYRGRVSAGEPQLGRRGLYRPTDSPAHRAAMLWLLNLADGERSLLDIAERSGLAFKELMAARDALVSAELLELVEEA